MSCLFSRPYRTLAPAGGFPSTQSIDKTWKKLGLGAEKPRASYFAAAKEILEERLQRHFTVRKAIIVGSGKEALRELFLAVKGTVKRDTVVMSAYTCPDVAAAAVQARLKIYPLDLRRESLEMDAASLPEEIASRTCAVVLSNLYGLVDPLSPWKQLRVKHGFAIIDDACQAALSREGERLVGAREGVYGVLSFGRGKSFCALGGGAMLFPAGSDASTIFQSASNQSFAMASPLLDGVADRIQAVLYPMFERPNLYFVPARLPWLGLGETRLRLDFPTEGLSVTQIAAALSQLESSAEQSSDFSRNTKRWSDALSQEKLIHPAVVRNERGAVLIRYPLLCGDEATRDRLLRALFDFGASGNYPKPLTAYRELEGHLLTTQAPVAEQIARTILTLPVHRYLTEKDVRQAASIIHQELSKK